MSKYAPRLTSTASGSVTLEWDVVPGASAYIVKYGTDSVASSTNQDAQYSDQSDPITATGTTITGLKNTTYYFALVGVTSQGDESDTFSNELKVVVGSSTSTSTGATVAAPTTTAAPTGTGTAPAPVTQSTPAPASALTTPPTTTSSTGTEAPVAPTASGAATNTSADFSVASVSVVDNKTLSIKFTGDLSTDAITLHVTKTSDNSDVTVDSVAVDPSDSKGAIAKLTGVLVPSTSYAVTVATATDVSGNAIATGVKGSSDFTTPDTLADTTPVALDAAGTGTTASGATVGTGATSTGVAASAADAMKSQDLPATGTKENLLVVASLAIAFVIVMARRRKA